MATAVQENKELVRRVTEGLNDQSRDVFDELHTRDVVIHDGDEEVHGIDGALEHESALWDAFPDLHHTIDEMVAEGDRVAYRFTATGTHRNEFRGIPPTDRRFEVTGQGQVRISDGEIAEVWLNYDALGMLQQLGVADHG